MKKYLPLCALFLGACAQQFPTSASLADTATQASLDACLMREAQAAVADGSAFAAPLKTTARGIVGACFDVLSLSSESLEASATQKTQALLARLLSTPAE